MRAQVLRNPQLNEIAVAHYFAVRTPQDGQTFFENIRELLPAHVLKANAANHHLRRYWSPDPYKKIRYKNDEEYAEHFRSLLEESIRSRMRSSVPGRRADERRIGFNFGRLFGCTDDGSKTPDNRFICI